MLLRRVIFGFLARFIVVYGLLIAPWPGLAETYARGFRALGNAIFAKDDAAHLIRFEPVPAELKHRLDTRILLANRAKVDENGNLAALYLELDSRAVGWIPTVLIIALVVATPVSLRRRTRALFIGLVGVYAFVVFSLAIYLWNNLPAVGMITLGVGTKHVLEGLEETLITQLGASFVVPVLIWLFATFRWQDITEAKQRVIPGISPQPSQIR